MSLLVIQHESDGTIAEWRYEADNDYEPAAGELVVDTGDVDHRDIVGLRVDVEADPPEIVEDPDYVEPTPMDERVSSLENAVGANGPVKRGIAERIDDLEDRVAALEDSS